MDAKVNEHRGNGLVHVYIYMTKLICFKRVML